MVDRIKKGLTRNGFTTITDDQYVLYRIIRSTRSNRLEPDKKKKDRSAPENDDRRCSVGRPVLHHLCITDGIHRQYVIWRAG